MKVLTAGLQRDVVGRVPELMTESLPETAEGTLAQSGSGMALSHLEQADAIVVGPGLTRHPKTRGLVHEVVRR